MNAPGSPSVALLVLLPLIAWRMYSRFRRMVGKQSLSMGRLWFTVVLFPALIVLLGVGARAHLERVELMAGGVVLGCLLGVFGLKRTQFEATPRGLFYTPNAHLGIALSLLFMGRIVFRLMQVGTLDPSANQGAQDIGSSGVTLAVFGLLAGYYVSYAVGLMRWKSSVGTLTETNEAPSDVKPDEARDCEERV